MESVVLESRVAPQLGKSMQEMAKDTLVASLEGVSAHVSGA